MSELAHPFGLDIRTALLVEQVQYKFIPHKFFEKTAYPDNYYKNLCNISDYCGKNNIKLIFWIPPTHMDFQNSLKEYQWFIAGTVQDVSLVNILAVCCPLTIVDTVATTPAVQTS